MRRNRIISAAALFLCGACACADVAPGGGKDSSAFRSPGKALAPVALDIPRVYRVQPGETQTVRLVLKTLSNCDSLRIEINADDGLALAGGRRMFRFDGCRAGGSEELPVVVTAQRDGKHYLNVIATVEFQASTRMRAFAVPFEVGDVAAAMKAQRVEADLDENGEPVRVMRAADDSSAIK